MTGKKRRADAAVCTAASRNEYWVNSPRFRLEDHEGYVSLLLCFCQAPVIYGILN